MFFLRSKRATTGKIIRKVIKIDLIRVIDVKRKLKMAKSIKEDYKHSDSGISGQYKTWFLDYASYVILERAVPAMEDGLKPVQRTHSSCNEGNG